MEIKKELEVSNIPGYYIRLRRDQTKNGFVYYNGVKTFKVNNSEISELNESLFMFNDKNVLKPGIVDNIKENRKNFYEKFEIDSITFELGNYGINNLDKREEAFKVVEENCKCKITKLEDPEDRYEIKTTDKSIENEYKIFKYLYKEYKVGRTNVFRDSIAVYNTESKDINDIADFYETTKKLVNDYYEYTHLELEKKYQHLFLLSVKKIFDDDMIPFEEEYYLNDQEGRIDCIFYKSDDNKISDIYLIELKVDESVIGGSNGIHKHLDDLRQIDGDAKDIKNSTKFYDTLLNNINYRREQLGQSKLEYSNDCACNFYIIVGYTKTLDDIKNKLDRINNPNSNDNRKLPARYKGKTIRDMVNQLKNINVKIILDYTKWDSKDNSRNAINPDFRDETTKYIS